jgi:hypothetical protein
MWLDKNNALNMKGLAAMAVNPELCQTKEKTINPLKVIVKSKR